MPHGAKAFHCAIGPRGSSKPGRGGARRRTRLSRLSRRLERLLLVSWHSESFFTSQPQAPFSFEGHRTTSKKSVSAAAGNCGAVYITESINNCVEGSPVRNQTLVNKPRACETE